ncbi:MAG: glycosyltransferase family 2 protein [Oscillospiraceae bacterium]|nr:glycosyltransferase family 2 protein [Oscillospiraceae bacterium]
MTELSIVVPIYNEEGNVAPLHKEIKDVCEEQGYTYEIIFIDDGSTDRTGAIAKTLSPIKYVRLRRNFGQTAAMDAGIALAQYAYIVTMDGDMQNDPRDIPKLIAHAEEHDLDIVSGWRKNRKDPLMKRFFSRGANLLRSIIVKDDIHDSGCSLKLYRRECFEQITLYGEMHRFIPALCKIKGFTVGETEVNHRPRASGVTKYNYKRAMKGFIDMISLWFWGKFASRPLHLFGFFGLLSLMLTLVTGVISVVIYIRTGNISNTPWLTITTIFLIAGLQMFTFGLLSDIMSKIYRETTKDKAYSIKEVIDRRDGPDGETETV